MCFVQYTNIKFYCHTGKWKQKFHRNFGEQVRNQSKVSEQNHMLKDGA